MGKRGNRDGSQKQKNQTGGGVNMPGDEENRSSQTEISQPTSGQEPALVQYECGHFDAKPLKHTVDILVGTVKFVPDQRNIEEGLIKGRIEFMCVPYVDGSITVEFYEMVLESPGSSPTKKVLLKTSPALEAKRKSGKHITGVDISFIHKICLKEQYKVEIKTKADEDTGGIKVHELTLAVFEKVEDDIQIKVTDQIVWVNERRFSCLDSSGIFKALDIDNKKSAPECGTCLASKNPGVLTPVGNISVTTEKIGSGSRTTVFNGTFQDQHCAVKRYPIKHKEAADNDIKMMKDIGSRSNIVSYIGTAKTDKFVLVAVEKCETSLDKLIASLVLENNEYKLTLEGFKDLVLWTCKNDRTKLYPTEHLLKFLRGIVFGLDFLHSRKISHNNLKIQNVLINRDTTDIIPKLSNFSLSCKLGTTGVSSSGGQDPENEKPTFPGDLLALGNLLLDCITITRDGKALSKKVKKINWVTHLPEAHDLITLLQDSDPKLRPTAAQAKNHPFLWGHKERLDFLRDASDWIELEPHGSKIREPIFQHKDYKGWDKKVGTKLVDEIELQQQRLNKMNNTIFTVSYHGVTLLRAIRNKYGHYITQSETLGSELGETVTEIDDYFSSRFPNFLMLVYNVLKNNLVEGKLFDKYFKP